MKKNLFITLLWIVCLITASTHASDDAIDNLRQTGKAFAAVARAVSLSVVYIQIEGKTSSESSPFSSPFKDEVAV